MDYKYGLVKYSENPVINTIHRIRSAVYRFNRYQICDLITMPMLYPLIPTILYLCFIKDDISNMLFTYLRNTDLHNIITFLVGSSIIAFIVCLAWIIVFSLFVLIVPPIIKAIGNLITDFILKRKGYTVKFVKCIDDDTLILPVDDDNNWLQFYTKTEKIKSAKNREFSREYLSNVMFRRKFYLVIMNNLNGTQRPMLNKFIVNRLIRRLVSNYLGIVRLNFYTDIE